MTASPQREPLINKLFHATRVLEASDLYLDVGMPPRFKLRGDVRYLDSRSLTQEDLVRAVAVILDGEQLERLERGNDIVVTHTCPEGVVYRVSVFNKDGCFSLWARRLRGTLDSPLHLSATTPAEPEVAETANSAGAAALQNRTTCFT